MGRIAVVGLAGLCLFGPQAFAEEPLLLRIRPNDDAGEAARARALREQVWTRSDRRARIAIASVCTGCLEPPAAVDSPGDAIVANGSVAGPRPILATSGDP